MSEVKSASPVKEAFAGTGLGILVGLLLGLSVEHLVGTIIGALAAALAVFLGLARNSGSDKALRIGFFGLSCAAGALGGLTLRGNSFLYPSILSQVEQWKSAGYSQSDALAYVAFERLGIKPSDHEVVPPPAPPVVLYATPVSLCEQLHLLSDTDAQRLLAETKDLAGKALLAASNAAAEPERLLVLHAGVQVLCD
jgi:hypothetical protein